MALKAWSGLEKCFVSFRFVVSVLDIYFLHHITVVLGRPGSGCSTFLKTIANHREEYHSVTGEVHYDSLSPEDVTKHFRGDVQYCPEDDVHFPTLTVNQVSCVSSRNLLFI